jgi:hypothetical protein
MKDITKKYSAVIPLNDPSPVAYLNVFEEGDVWIKIKGCDECSEENKKRCCKMCPMSLPNGDCYWHIESKEISRKSFYCVIVPHPQTFNTHCSLEFKCVEGSRKGQIRRVKDKPEVFQK